MDTIKHMRTALAAASIAALLGCGRQDISLPRDVFRYEGRIGPVVYTTDEKGDLVVLVTPVPRDQAAPCYVAKYDHRIQGMRWTAELMAANAAGSTVRLYDGKRRNFLVPLDDVQVSGCEHFSGFDVLR